MRRGRGSHVAYVTGRSLMVARSDGSEPRRVSRWAGSLTWSPTGDRIAFAQGRQLSLLNAATGMVTLLAEVEKTPPDSLLSVIDFSPEGDRILFSRLKDEDGVSSLWSIDVDGSHLRRLVAGTSSGDWFSPRSD
jgi:Tol biopolymer transport system component